MERAYVSLPAVSYESNALRLDERVVLITGGAGGIGEAIGRTFMRAGAAVALCDRDGDGLSRVADEFRSAGARVWDAVFDVREASDVNAFVAELAADAGRIDVLVNNAGGGFHAPFLEVSQKGEMALIRENFTSVTAFIRAVVPRMPEGGGAIVNLTSIEAHRAAPGYAVYAAMKAAVANLTASLALELGDRGIRINCIAPDVIPTPGIGEPPVRTPLSRAGRVEDVAAAALYLASNASAFVTGTTLHVDGGNRAAGGWRRAVGGGWEA